MPLPIYNVKSSGYGNPQSDTTAGAAAPKVKGMQIMRNDTVVFCNHGQCPSSKWGEKSGGREDTFVLGVQLCGGRMEGVG